MEKGRFAGERRGNDERGAEKEEGGGNTVE